MHMIARPRVFYTGLLLNSLKTSNSVSTLAPQVLIARTDADSAALLTSDIDDCDKAFCTGERTPEGFFKIRPGVEVTMHLFASAPCAAVHSSIAHLPSSSRPRIAL